MPIAQNALRTLSALSMLMQILLHVHADVAANDKPMRADDSGVRLLARGQIEPYINWLPNDTETLIVLREKYTIPMESPEFNAGMTFAMQEQEGWLNGVFDHRHARALLSGKVLTLFIEGSCQFRLPRKSGCDGVLNDGCVVLVFEQSLGEAQQALFRQMRVMGAKPCAVHGVSALEYTPRRLRGNAAGISFWITSPKPDVLLIATSSDFLKAILEKMARPDKTALPTTLSNWRHIDAAATVWGMREYQPRNPQVLDISDARWREGLELPAFANATGFSFQQNEADNRIEIVWLGCDDGMIEKLRKSIRHRVAKDEVDCAVQSEGNGVLRITVVWPDAKDLPRAAERRQMRSGIEMWLWWYLGRAGCP